MNWFAWNGPEFLTPGWVHSIRAITRPKIGGFGTHSGLLLELCTGQRVVYDRAPGRGLRRSTVEQFLHGRRGWTGSSITESQAIASSMGRLRALLASPIGHVYDAIGNNCEHLVTYVLAGQKRSPQVAGAALTAAVVAVACFL